MNELKELVGLINSLPQIALWVMVGFWAYKVIVVGSVYGVIRLCITKGYEAYTKPRVVQFDIQGMCISQGVASDIKNEISRALNYGHAYCMTSDAVWLRQAIDEKKAREQEMIDEGDKEKLEAYARSMQQAVNLR